MSKETTKNPPKLETIWPKDPKITGPGIWFNIHLLAHRATTPDLKKYFLWYIDTLTEYFPCSNCRKHMKNYVDTHPIRAFDDTQDSEGNDVGYFTWAWKFHNFANKFLGKKEIPYDLAYKSIINLPHMVCLPEDEDCSGDTDNTKVEITKTKTKPVDEENKKKIKDKPRSKFVQRKV